MERGRSLVSILSRCLRTSHVTHSSLNDIFTCKFVQTHRNYATLIRALKIHVKRKTLQQGNAKKSMSCGRRFTGVCLTLQRGKRCCRPRRCLSAVLDSGCPRGGVSLARSLARSRNQQTVRPSTRDNAMSLLLTAPIDHVSGAAVTSVSVWGLS